MSTTADSTRTSFEAQLTGPSAVFKVSDKDGGDQFVIWGKASVEVVDKEGDKITAQALKEALPQLLRRERLSLEHSDQLVGDIKESFEAEEEVTVEVDGKEYTRKEFPTDVLEMDGEEPALFVAGKVWDDTRQARETRKAIEDGEIDSYSISGEAISSSTKVKDGEVYDEITELDLSAVTLCEEGMNQKSKFGTVTKEDDDPTVASNPSVIKIDSNHEHMSNQDTEKSGEEDDLLTREDLHGEFKTAAAEALKESDFVTRSDVESIVEEKMASDGEAAEKEEESDEDDSSDNISDEASDDEEEEKADNEEMPDDESPDEEEESVVDEEPELPDEKNDEAVQTAVDAVVSAYPELDPAEVESSIQGLVEGSDGDDEVVPEKVDEESDDADEVDPEDDESVPGDEAEEKGDVVSQLESEGVPDDLIDAVSEYVDDGGDEDIVEPDEEPVEEDEMETFEASEKKEKEAISGDDLDTLSKDDDVDGYLDVTASAAIPTTDEDEDLMKSFERGDETVEESNSALEAFYNGLGEEV